MTVTTRHRRLELGRRTLLWASDTTVTATASARLEPTFLIVGAQRSGTTSMFKSLVQHPDIARPFLRKGIHYFDKNYDRSWAWYRGHFPLRISSRIRRAGGGVHTGESSPYYMFHPRAAERIAHDLPGVRLIMLLRDPVERAYSAHAHELVRGFESLPFEQAISAEPARVEGERERMAVDPTYDSAALQHQSYLGRGRYIEQIERIVGLVGRDRLHVIDSADFFGDPQSTFDGVLRFLGLRRAGNISFDKHNARQRSSMDPRIRAELAAYFQPWDAALAEWWGRTPSWRR